MQINVIDILTFDNDINIFFSFVILCANKCIVNSISTGTVDVVKYHSIC